MNMKLSKAQLPIIAKRYKRGESSITISKDYGVCSETVINFLRKNKVTIREAGPSRKYHLVEDFFDVINTQEKAYFLGFLFADGCNHGGRVSLNLSEKDLSILKVLNKLVHPRGKPIYRGKSRVTKFPNRKKEAVTKTNYTINIESKHVSEALAKHGCIPRKTDIIKFPIKSVPEHLISHFTRGYFDGDGSVSIYRSEKTKHRTCGYVSIMSTLDFSNTLKNILEKREIHSKIFGKRKKYKTRNVREMRITKNQDVLRFYDWLYDGASIYLKRKKDVFDTMRKERKKYESKELHVCCICDSKHYGKGYCNRHYQTYIRKRKAIERTAKDILDFFSGHVNNISKKETKHIIQECIKNV